MRPDLEQYYLIDQYLENKLKGEDLTAFENQLISNPSLVKEVEEQRMLNNLILEAELKDVRTQLEKDLSNIQKTTFFRKYWKWIGLGLLSISSILYYTVSSKDEFNLSPNESSEQLIETKNQPVLQPMQRTVQTNNITKKHQPSNTVSKTEVSEQKNIVTATDNIPAIKNIEVLIPNAMTSSNTIQSSDAQSAEVEKTIDCSLTKINFAVITETTCSNTETGSIHIEKIAGGVAPYAFTLNNKKIKEKDISNLAAGTYEVKISDKNGCSAEHTAIVSEKICTPAIRQGEKFNINPSIGETCSIPFHTDKKGRITIYNRIGKIIFQTTDPSTDFVEWAGTDGYGTLAEAGLYVYLIEYTDGTKVTGEVNIIR